jgi:hypothetical protein
MDAVLKRHEFDAADAQNLAADFANVTLANVTFANLIDFASFALFAIRIAVTILPAGTAGAAVVDLGALPAVGLAAEDLMSDFLETAMGKTSGLSLTSSTALPSASRVPNRPPLNNFIYAIENK